MSDSVALRSWRHRARAAGNGHRRPPAKAVASVVAAVAVGFAGLGARARSAPHDPPALPGPPRCPAVATPLHADVNGDGCDEDVAFADGVLIAGPVQMRVGAPGD